jgi:tetratricopeptide (TPR) repeat protein
MNRHALLVALLLTGRTLVGAQEPPAADPHAGHQQGGEHAPAPAAPPGPGPGPHAAPPSPASNLTPPGPEESAALERLSKLKAQTPRNPEEEGKLRGQYLDALRDLVLGFPDSPRAPFALEALLKLLVSSGEAGKAEGVLKEYIEKAKSPLSKMIGEREMVQVLRHSGQIDRAIAYAKERTAAQTDPLAAEWFAYEAANIEADRARFTEALAILDGFIAKNPKHPAVNKFRLRTADFLVSAGKPQEALARLDAFMKQELRPEEKALATYFLGIGHLAASRQATGEAAAELRKKARGAIDPLLEGTRKDREANAPYGAMSFTTAAAIALAAGDVTGAVKIYEEMAQLFRGKPEGEFADRASRDVQFIGTPLEAIEGPTLDGKTVNVKSFRGKILLLDFFSAGYAGYPQELAVTKRIRKKVGGGPLAVLSVNLDKNEQVAAVKGLVAQAGMDWPVIFDGKGFESPIAKMHNVTGLPANFVVDENGVVLRAALRGPHLEDLVVQEVARVSKGLPSPMKRKSGSK